MSFTPIQTSLGGYLLHLSTSSLLTETGRVFGISGIVDNALLGDRATWRWVTILGLMVGPVVASSFGNLGLDDGLAMWKGLPAGRIGLAGLLVGMGTKLGSGCTSGHFLCGVSRLSPRSLIATFTFFSTAMVTANLFPAPVPSFSLPAKGYQLSNLPHNTMVTLSAVVCAVIAAQKAVRLLLSSYNRPNLNPTGVNTASTSMNVGPSKLERQLPYFLHGLIFSLGLIISGMVSPLKVLSFLQPLSPSFDPSLAMIVLAGVIPNGIHYMRERDGKKAMYKWETWRVPNRKDIDWKLITGSMLFGMGWGMAGVCPGPAVVGLTHGLLVGRGVEKIALWLGAMIGGMALARAVEG